MAVKTRSLVQSTRDCQHELRRHKTASITSSQESRDLKITKLYREQIEQWNEAKTRKKAQKQQLVLQNEQINLIQFKDEIIVKLAEANVTDNGLQILMATSMRMSSKTLSVQ